MSRLITIGWRDGIPFVAAMWLDVAYLCWLAYKIGVSRRAIFLDGLAIRGGNIRHRHAGHERGDGQTEVFTAIAI